MDKSVKKDITKRYRQMLERIEKEESNIGHTDCFQCSQCSHVIKTVNRDSGVVPMGIECPHCHGEAYHLDEDNPNIPITHEWYRSTLEETLSLADGHLFTVSMILGGGLLRKEKQDG